MLSISGARGIVGSSMTPVVASTFASALASELIQRSGKVHPLVVIGRDSRPSGEMLEAAAVSGLVACGCRVVRLGIVMTPTVAVMIDAHKADGGMVLTASHNPIIWNGLKCLNSLCAAPPADEADAIIARFHEGRFSYVDVHNLIGTDVNDSAGEVHVNRVLDLTDVEAVRGERFKVVLDSVNGAGCAAGRMLLERLGAQLIHINGEPTGRFAHTPEPVEENLTELAKAVRESGADIGFAQDPDADRLAIVDERGRYIGEEMTFVLAALSLFIRQGNIPGRSVAVNLSTSRMIDDVAAPYSAFVYRTPVGEANVADAMRRHGCLIGGEGNGGVIRPGVCFVRDSLSGMALVLELLAKRGRPALSEVVSQLPQYVIRKSKVAIEPGLADRAIEKLAAQYSCSARLDRQDGLRLDFDERRAWLHIRPSNTEPILRMIAEAPDAAQADTLISQARLALGKQDMQVL